MKSPVLAQDLFRIRYQQIYPEKINAQKFPQIYNSVLRVMQKDGDNSPIDCYFDGGRLFAKFGNSLAYYNEIMLRQYFPVYMGNQERHNAIVVARIMFIHRHRGNMTELEQALISIVKKTQDLDQIIIEQVVQTDMMSWCNSHGYKPLQYQPGSYIKIINTTEHAKKQEIKKKQSGIYLDSDIPLVIKMPRNN